jgi:hypothetical protein
MTSLHSTRPSPMHIHTSQAGSGPRQTATPAVGITTQHIPPECGSFGPWDVWDEDTTLSPPYSLHTTRIAVGPTHHGPC